MSSGKNQNFRRHRTHNKGIYLSADSNFDRTKQIQEFAKEHKIHLSMFYASRRNILCRAKHCDTNFHYRTFLLIIYIT